MLQKGTQHVTSNTFEIHIDNTILYYEAPSTQIMLQWVTLISNMVKTEHLLINSSLSYRHYRGYDGNKSILVSVWVDGCSDHKVTNTLHFPAIRVFVCQAGFQEFFSTSILRADQKRKLRWTHHV